MNGPKRTRGRKAHKDTRPKILAIDKAWRNFGWVIAVPGAEDNPEFVGAGLICTKNKAADPKAYVDNWVQTGDVFRAFRQIVHAHKIRGVCVEADIGSQNVAGARGAARASTICACLCSVEGLGAYQVTPQRVKKVLCGKNNASKDDVREATLAYVGAAEIETWLTDAGVAPGKWEHCYDAAGVAIASWHSDVILAARKQ